jgi:hypothetical protein
VKVSGVLEALSEVMCPGALVPILLHAHWSLLLPCDFPPILPQGPLLSRQLGLGLDFSRLLLLKCRPNHLLSNRKGNKHLSVFELGIC